jgi:hypothetical protein
MSKKEQSEEVLVSIKMPRELKEAALKEAIRRGYGKKTGLSTLVRVELSPFLSKNIENSI